MPRLSRAQVLEQGYDVRTIQELLGHRDVSTTMICAHVLEQAGEAELCAARWTADPLPTLEAGSLSRPVIRCLAGSPYSEKGFRSLRANSVPSKEIRARVRVRSLGAINRLPAKRRFAVSVGGPN